MDGDGQVHILGSPNRYPYLQLVHSHSVHRLIDLSELDMVHSGSIQGYGQRGGVSSVLAIASDYHMVPTRQVDKHTATDILRNHILPERLITKQCHVGKPQIA